MVGVVRTKGLIIARQTGSRERAGARRPHSEAACDKRTKPLAASRPDQL
jgi:hypothetical protein